MNSTLTPVQGCLIKLDINGEARYGIVSQIKNEETCIVKWFDKAQRPLYPAHIPP